MTKQYREFSNARGTSLPTPKSPSRPKNGTTGLSPSSAIGSLSVGVSRKATGPSGFLGQTSFSATIHGCDDESCDECEDVDPTFEMDPAEVAMGMNVLRVLPGHGDCQTVLKKYLAGPGEVGFLKPTIQILLDSLFDTYGSYLKQQREDYQLEKVSEAITRKSIECLVLPDSAPGWMEAFSGTNTRWESMGIILVAIANGILAVPDRDFTFLGLASSFTEKKKAVLAIKEGVELCLELCRHNLNTLVCHLLYKNLLLETVLHGDSSKWLRLSVWRLHHDLVAIASAIGLHCYNPSNPQKEPGALTETWHLIKPKDPGSLGVTLRTEIRKRLSASCFWSDKELAMFTGRPPAWSHRYHSCPLPYDVSDEALIEGGERLEKELSELDENGWNTKGEVYDSTSSRTMVLTAMLLDEIMEIFVGNSCQWSMERVRGLKIKAFEIYSKIPHVLQVTKESLKLIKDDIKMWKLMFMRLDYLRMQFLLERLSAERGGESRQKLVDVAREIVDMIVFLWLERDRCGYRHYDYDYIIMCYGMPSTGILCTELLKQMKQPNAVDAKMPVSEVVRNLSLMIGFLDWTKPTAGNYKLCQRMSQCVKKVLDQVFTPSEKERAPESQAPPTPDTMTDLLSFDDSDDFEWLSSIDWGRGPYMDMIHLN
ncbi:hypothetical protein N431DRAFT_344468 [Stipitochalara longipes BDJ]|nr:hypothetical protein N431DRAFT_344468 [Stipitochalara longipes BDJ]